MCQGTTRVARPRRSSLKDSSATSTSSSRSFFHHRQRKSNNGSSARGLVKSVRFGSKIRVKRIPPLATFTERDIDVSWYSRAEVDTITRAADDLVIKAEESPEGTSVREFDGESIRGLERKTQDGHTEAFLARVHVYQAVLDEQAVQKSRSSKAKLEDVQRIATLSQRASDQSRLAALQRAKQDEADVQLYLYTSDHDQGRGRGQTKECLMKQKHELPGIQGLKNRLMTLKSSRMEHVANQKAAEEPTISDDKATTTAVTAATTARRPLVIPPASSKSYRRETMSMIRADTSWITKATVASTASMESFESLDSMGSDDMDSDTCMDTDESNTDRTADSNISNSNRSNRSNNSDSGGKEENESEEDTNQKKFGMKRRSSSYLRTGQAMANPLQVAAPELTSPPTSPTASLEEESPVRRTRTFTSSTRSKAPPVVPAQLDEDPSSPEPIIVATIGSNSMDDDGSDLSMDSTDSISSAIRRTSEAFANANANANETKDEPVPQQDNGQAQIPSSATKRRPSSYFRTGLAPSRGLGQVTTTTTSMEATATPTGMSSPPASLKKAAEEPSESQQQETKAQKPSYTRRSSSYFRTGQAPPQGQSTEATPAVEATPPISPKKTTQAAGPPLRRLGTYTGTNQIATRSRPTATTTSVAMTPKVSSSKPIVVKIISADNNDENQVKAPESTAPPSSPTTSEDSPTKKLPAAGRRMRSNRSNRSNRSATRCKAAAAISARAEVIPAPESPTSKKAQERARIKIISVVPTSPTSPNSSTGTGASSPSTNKRVSRSSRINRNCSYKQTGNIATKPKTTVTTVIVRKEPAPEDAATKAQAKPTSPKRTTRTRRVRRDSTYKKTDQVAKPTIATTVTKGSTPTPTPAPVPVHVPAPPTATATAPAPVTVTKDATTRAPVPPTATATAPSASPEEPRKDGNYSSTFNLFDVLTDPNFETNLEVALWETERTEAPKSMDKACVVAAAAKREEPAPSKANPAHTSPPTTKSPRSSRSSRPQRSSTSDRTKTTEEIATKPDAAVRARGTHDATPLTTKNSSTTSFDVFAVLTDPDFETNLEVTLANLNISQEEIKPNIAQPKTADPIAAEESERGTVTEDPVTTPTSPSPKLTRPSPRTRRTSTYRRTGPVATTMGRAMADEQPPALPATSHKMKAGWPTSDAGSSLNTGASAKQVVSPNKCTATTKRASRRKVAPAPIPPTAPTLASSPKKKAPKAKVVAVATRSAIPGPTMKKIFPMTTERSGRKRLSLHCSAFL